MGLALLAQQCLGGASHFAAQRKQCTLILCVRGALAPPVCTGTLNAHQTPWMLPCRPQLRRIKEALGLGAGPEAPGVVFSGLEGEEPDWQLMPMPVGYLGMGSY